MSNNDIYIDNKQDYIDNNSVDEETVASRHSALNKLFVFAFLIIIFFVGIFHFLSADLEYSENENRVLAKMPKLTWAAVTDGSFMSDFETYLADQFPFRDTLISIKTTCDRVLGKNKENGIYIGENGFLFDSQTEFSKEKTEGMTDAINSFIKKSKIKNKAVFIAPNASYVYDKYFPEYLNMPSQKDMLEYISSGLSDSIKVIDSCKLMKRAAKENDQLYYKTDHHWTTLGAYEAFKSLSKVWNLGSENIIYDFFTVSTTFEGTLGSKAGVHETTDEIIVCVPDKSEGTYVVNLEKQGVKKGSFFFKDKLAQKNQYEVFLGGNYDKVTITTTADNEKSLLLIKDSFANCFVPMLTPYFSKIVMVDPRYLTDSLSAIVSENSFTHVLFLYNMNTFLEDNSLVGCLES